jgi:hypothetical protein
MTRPTTELGCACGEVRLVVERAPIIVAECHCNSCRAAAERLRARGAAPTFQEPNGGTPFTLYRKDRVRFVAGAARLKELRLTPTSKTRRVVASCCNTPVFLELHGGHWLSLYSNLWPAPARLMPELRTMTSDLPDRAALDDAIPSGALRTGAFFARLLWAWIAMGFRSPVIEVPGGAFAA